MTLYHYFDRSTGPFRNLSDLSDEEAKTVLREIRQKRPRSQAASRDEKYMARRAAYERTAYDLFLKMGGRPRRKTPHTMAVEACDWLYSWYEKPSFVRIPIEAFDLKTLSFTYGDLHPTFSPIVTDGKEYRKKLYLYPDILKIIEKYELPQNMPPAEGVIGLPRYVEVQIWSDETVLAYRDERFWN